MTGSNTPTEGRRTYFLEGPTKPKTALGYKNPPTLGRSVRTRMRGFTLSPTPLPPTPCRPSDQKSRTLVPKIVTFGGGIGYETFRRFSPFPAPGYETFGGTAGGCLGATSLNARGGVSPSAPQLCPAPGYETSGPTQAGFGPCGTRVRDLWSNGAAKGTRVWELSPSGAAGGTRVRDLHGWGSPTFLSEIDFVKSAYPRSAC